MQVVGLAYLAFAAADLGNRREARRWAAKATRAVAEEHLEGTGTVPWRTRRKLRHSWRAATTLQLPARSRTYGASAHYSVVLRGSTPISRCAAQTSASTSAIVPAPSSSRRSRRRLAPISRRRHASSPPVPRLTDQARGGLRPQLGRAPSPSLPSHAPLAPGDRRSPLPLTPDRQDNRSSRSTPSWTSRADPRQSSSSTSSASDRQRARSRSRIRTTPEVANRPWSR